MDAVYSIITLIPKVSAAKKLIQQIFSGTERLEKFPKSGRKVPELQDLRYLEIIVNPCRIFYRVEKDRSRQSGGSGLGLAIVKKIVELHHGNVQVVDLPENGSRFILTIPQFPPLREPL